MMKTITDIPWIEVMIFIRELLTVIGILVGLYYGRKGIKRYLLGDILKDKFTELHQSNKKAIFHVDSLLKVIGNDSMSLKPMTESEIKRIDEITGKLVEETNGASSEVHTLSLYLYYTTKGVKPSAERKNQYEKRLSNEYYYLINSTCRKIKYYASNVIDLPKTEKLELYSSIRKKYQKFLSTKGFYTIKGYKFGPDISSSSTLSLAFFNILNRHSINYVFSRKFCQFIQSNHPVMINLYADNLYFPGKIKSKKEELLGYEYLHLIKYKISDIHKSDGSRDMTVEFYYSNILSMFGFVEGMDIEKFKNDFIDDYINTGDIFKNYIKNTLKKFDETITFTCNYHDIQLLFKNNERSFKNRLIEEKINS